MMIQEEIRVIAIPDEYTVYVNSGSENKLLKRGHILLIVEIGKELFDVDGTSLGNAMRSKEEVEVLQIYPKYSVCKKREKTITSYDKILSNAGKTTYSKLNIGKSNIVPIFSDNVSPVEVGDLVIIK